MYSNKNTMINITYAITVCNELEEITKLIDFLKDKIEKEDEILIQYDEVSVTTAVKNYLTIISQLHNTNIRVIGFPLNQLKVERFISNLCLQILVRYMINYQYLHIFGKKM